MEILWNDRKRILGMPISFTKYSVSEDRLFVEKGFLNLHQEEILLYRIRDISLKMTLGQRVFGVGSVLIQSSDQTAPELELKNIKDVRNVKELLHKQVEKMKITRKIQIGELLETGELDDGDPFDTDLD